MQLNLDKIKLKEIEAEKDKIAEQYSGWRVNIALKRKIIIEI